MASINDEPQLMYPAPLAPERGAILESSGNTAIDIETPILIVGAGPVGMLQALLFARLYNKPCTLVEKEPSTTTYPKMEYTNGRSMKIYRMLGLSEELHKMGVPGHHNNNELITTGLTKDNKHIYTWERPGPDDHRRKSKEINDGSQYLEPHVRCHQILIEKWLQEKVKAEKLISSHWATGYVTHEELDDHVLTKCTRADDMPLYIKSQYLIGCDGGGSWVRKSAGLESNREYLNMTMAFVHFRSKSLRISWPYPRAWHTNVIGGGLIVSQNEDDIWTCHMVCPPDVDLSTLTPDTILATVNGGTLGPIPLAYDEIFCRGTWRVDVAVANQFLSPGGRVLLAGDAAHQIVSRCHNAIFSDSCFKTLANIISLAQSPIGGHGLNSGIGDALDLAWKLTATMDGWGGENLLRTYDTERRQIAFENIGYVNDALSLFGPILSNPAGAVVNDEGPETEEAIATLQDFSRQLQWVHDQNGNILGYSYKQSPINFDGLESGERPKGTAHDIYVPTTYPGSQAPHVWTTSGTSTLDQLSPRTFSLVDFTGDASLSQPFVEAAKELNVPLQVVGLQGEQNVRKVYERDLILIRPDTHVAWRCGESGAKAQNKEGARKILNTVSGRSIYMSKTCKMPSTHYGTRSGR